MAARNVRVGIIGTGFGASVQLPGFLDLEDCQVIGIASSEPNRSKELQKTHTLLQSFTSAEELLASDDIDLVSIATPPAYHEKFVRAALVAGKHVLCEKPFTMSADVAKALLKEANAARIIHATDFEFRELPALKFFLSRLMVGSVGRIVYGELRWIVGTWADPTRPWRWQCDALQGGGVLTALGVHLFNVAESIFGTLDKLQAETGTGIKERTDEEGTQKPVTSEDHATMELKGKYGIPVRIRLSNVEKSGEGLTVMVRGEKGILLLESASQQYGSSLRVREGMSPDTAKVVYEDPKSEAGVDARIPPFRSLARRLINAIQEDDRTFSPSFQDGVRAQMFLEAVHASAEARSWVDIGKSSK